jgi:hypothetical protein
MMAAGLKATAKAVEHPPEPKIGAPVLDPTHPPAESTDFAMLGGIDDRNRVAIRRRN